MNISVIMPVYNTDSLLLEEAIDSVFNQTIMPRELIIVDDGSTNGAAETAKKHIEMLGARGDMCVKYIYQQNKGPAAARNSGIRQAAGDHIAFLDSDDIWLPNKLQKESDFLIANPQYRMVFCDMKHYEGGKMVHESYLKEKKYKHVASGNIFDNLLKECFVFTPTVLVDKCCFDNAGLFNENYKICEDYEMWLRIAQNYAIGFLDEPLVVRRRCGTNITLDRYLYHCSGVMLFEEMLKNNAQDKKTKAVLESELGQRYFNLGYFYWKNNDPVSAKDSFRRAVACRSNILRAVPYWICCSALSLKSSVVNNSKKTVSAEKEAIRYDERNIRSYSEESSVYDEKRYTGASGEFLFSALNEQLEKIIYPELVLDVATGTGRVSIGLSDKCSKIISLDLTYAMIARAKQKAAISNAGNVHFTIGNGRSLPFRSNTFSCITCVRFFHLFPFDVQNLFLDEFYRCVKPGGRIIVEYNNPFCNFGLDLMRDHKWRRNIRNMIWPWRINALKHKYGGVDTVGAVLPFHMRIKSSLPQYYDIYTSLSRHPVYKWLARFILLVIEKGKE